MKGIASASLYTCNYESSYFSSGAPFNTGIKRKIVCSVPNCTFSGDEVKGTEESCELAFSI